MGFASGHPILAGNRRGTVEVVERKELGPSDTICDALAEALSRGLCREYQRRFSAIEDVKVMGCGDRVCLTVSRAMIGHRNLGGGRGRRPGGTWQPGQRPDYTLSTNEPGSRHRKRTPSRTLGKIYNVVARNIAEALVATVPQIARAQCLMVSSIGAPCGALVGEFVARTGRRRIRAGARHHGNRRAEGTPKRNPQSHLLALFNRLFP
jgi:hypothetical protein